MEAVRGFNNELSSVYEMKPPISRAKMAAITKAAIRSIKYYKHIVQSVEKFILKCRPEYKVPGLYVIDSIVRQSRHQFGPEKDVFVPRFTKNIITTFQHLFKCPSDERSKIVRVLNLWQKNKVFPVEVIQPLLDLAADPTNPTVLSAAQQTIEAAAAKLMAQRQSQKVPDSTQPGGEPVPSSVEKTNEGKDGSGWAGWQSAADSSTSVDDGSDMLKTVTELLQASQQQSQSLTAQQQQLQQLQLLQQQLLQQTHMIGQQEEQNPAQQAQQAMMDSNLLSQINVLTQTLLSKNQDPVRGQDDGAFNKKLLDFDYGESDEDDDKKDHDAARQGNTSIGGVQTILSDPMVMQQIQQMSQTIQKTEQLRTELNLQEQLRQRLLLQQQEEFNQQILANQNKAQANNQNQQDSSQTDDNRDDERDKEEERSRGRDKRRRSRDRSKSPKKKKKRSRSRSRDRKRRSRSRERRHRRSRSRDRDRKERDKERERKKKGLPPIKDKTLSLCSTTMWIGHLSRFTTEEELRQEVEHYGEIISINMIPPRGCAFVSMSKRKDASKAVEKLKGVKLNGNALKTDWAPGKSVKDQNLNEYWNKDIGVTYIPWSKLPNDLTSLTDGGFIDDDTVPEDMRGVRSADEDSQDTSNVTPVDGSTPTPPVPFGMVPGMPPQIPFGNPMMGGMPMLPGMLPNMMMAGQAPPIMPPLPGMPPAMPPVNQPEPPKMQPSSAPDTKPPNVSAPTSGPTANNQLSQAIQNIISNSASITAVTQTTPGMMQPGMPPPNQNFGPGMQMPNFNMPPPGFDPTRPPPGIGGAGPPTSQSNNQPQSRPSLSEVLQKFAKGQGSSQGQQQTHQFHNKDVDMDMDEHMEPEEVEMQDVHHDHPPASRAPPFGGPPPQQDIRPPGPGVSGPGVNAPMGFRPMNIMTINSQRPPNPFNNNTNTNNLGARLLQQTMGGPPASISVIGGDTRPRGPGPQMEIRPINTGNDMRPRAPVPGPRPEMPGQQPRPPFGDMGPRPFGGDMGQRPRGPGDMGPRMQMMPSGGPMGMQQRPGMPPQMMQRFTGPPGGPRMLGPPIRQEFPPRFGMPFQGGRPPMHFRPMNPGMNEPRPMSQGMNEPRPMNPGMNAPRQNEPPDHFQRSRNMSEGEHDGNDRNQFSNDGNQGGPGGRGGPPSQVDAYFNRDSGNRNDRWPQGGPPHRGPDNENFRDNRGKFGREQERGVFNRDQDRGFRGERGDFRNEQNRDFRRNDQDRQDFRRDFRRDRDRDRDDRSGRDRFGRDRDRRSEDDRSHSRDRDRDRDREVDRSRDRDESRNKDDDRRRNRDDNRREERGRDRENDKDRRKSRWGDGNEVADDSKQAAAPEECVVQEAVSDPGAEQTSVGQEVVPEPEQPTVAPEEPVGFNPIPVQEPQHISETNEPAGMDMDQTTEFNSHSQEPVDTTETEYQSQSCAPEIVAQSDPSPIESESLPEPINTEPVSSEPVAQDESLQTTEPGVEES